MRYREWVLVVLTVHLLAFPLQAQWTTGVGGSGGGDMRGGGGAPGGGSMPGGGGPGGRGGMPGRPPGGRMELPTPEQLEGPLTPAAMSRVADLDSSATTRYAVRYTPYMAATAPVRDSLRSIMKSMRDEHDSADWDAMGDAMRERGPVISRLWKDLAKRDKQFYKEATKPFTKDERKRFEQWRDDKEKAYEAERRRGPGGGGRPGWPTQ